MNISAQVFEKAMAESRAAPIAETELATILAKEWCEQWGGWPSDGIERVAQIWAHRPAARKLLKAIAAVSKTDRRALAAKMAA